VPNFILLSSKSQFDQTNKVYGICCTNLSKMRANTHPHQVLVIIPQPIGNSVSTIITTNGKWFALTTQYRVTLIKMGKFHATIIYTISWTAIVVHSTDDKEVGMAHKVKSSENRSQFSHTTMGQYWLGKTKPKKAFRWTRNAFKKSPRNFKKLFNGIFWLTDWLTEWLTN